MANFMGGSATNMAAQICDGYILVSTATFRGYTVSDLQVLRMELDKLLRAARA